MHDLWVSVASILGNGNWKHEKWLRINFCGMLGCMACCMSDAWREDVLLWRFTFTMHNLYEQFKQAQLHSMLNLKHKRHCRKYTSNIDFIESMSLHFGDWKVIISLRSQNTNCRRRFLHNNGYDETLHFCERVWSPKTQLELFRLVKNAHFCCRPVLSWLPSKYIFTVTEKTSQIVPHSP